jgi:hypothetical protein
MVRWGPISCDLGAPTPTDSCLPASLRFESDEMLAAESVSLRTVQD